MKKRKLLEFLGTGLLCVAAIFLALHWVRGYQEIELDPDEVVWVLDAQFGVWYASGEWERFTITEHYSQLGWSDHRYRIIDQPQLGKYLHAVVLGVAGLHPWSARDAQLYRQFAQRELPGGRLNELDDDLGSEMVQSIELLRGLNVILTLGLVVSISGIMWWFCHKKIWVGVLTAITLLNMVVLQQYFRLAIVNSYAAWFQFLTVISGVFFLKKIKQLPYAPKKCVMMGCVTGVCAALATSVKLDGGFLWLIPVFIVFWFWFIEVREVVIKNWLWWVVGFIGAGSVCFLLLEPELWGDPIWGVEQLVGSRIAQQERFAFFFADLSLFDRFEKMGLLLLGSYPVSVVFGLGVGLGAFLYVVGKNSTKRHFSADVELALVTLPLIIASLYTTRVGFDRYFIPMLVVFLIWSVRGLYLLWMKIEKKYVT